VKFLTREELDLLLKRNEERGVCRESSQVFEDTFHEKYGSIYRILLTKKPEVGDLIIRYWDNWSGNGAAAWEPKVLTQTRYYADEVVEVYPRMLEANRFPHYFVGVERIDGDL